LAQTEHVADALRDAHPTLEVRLEIVDTRGDTDARPVEALGAGAFVTEVQRAVLEGRADVAVHSYKDLPTRPHPGLHVAAVVRRADPRDALVTRRGVVLSYLEEGSSIGTGSRRRAAQLRRRRRDLRVEAIRGNVDTRLRRLDAGDFDAIVIAAAGLIRLGLAGRITEAFDVEEMVPAAAQGAVALETREGDRDSEQMVLPLHDPDSAFEVEAERSTLAALGAGCNAPVGVNARALGQTMQIDGIVLTDDGKRAAKIRWSGPRTMPANEVGSILAELLTQSGAEEILRGTEK
jgi:hydroxymethylbilane synthase